jgi:membrane dipeptidase
MITYVGSFISPEVSAWSARRDSAARLSRQRNGENSPAHERAMAEWVAANPEPRATLGQVADHIEHVRSVAGIDHVGIGADFDGTSQLPIGLEDVSTYPALYAELSRRGWRDPELKKLAGENILRVMTQAERVAARIRRERPPSSATIEQLDTPRSPAGRGGSAPRSGKRSGPGQVKRK